MRSSTSHLPNSSAPHDTVVRGFNLLRLTGVRRFVLSPLFPYIFQAATLALFVWLAVFGWGLAVPEGVKDKLYAKTNLVNLLVWGLWWPFMVLIIVCLGRAWCMVCPLELVANVTERLGRALGIRQLVLGKWLRSGALIVAIYALIQMMVAGAHLHRNPHYTSIFLWAMLALAILTGLTLKDRAFCRGFCPVGMLLGVYGRGAMLAMRPISSDTCAECTDRRCVEPNRRTRLDARSCPSLLNPAGLNSNTDCLVCGQCIKSCQPANMGLFLRRPFPKTDAREMIASWPVTLFVMILSGFVAYELCTEWAAAKAVYLAAPELGAEWLGLGAYEGWIKGTWMLFVLPMLLWTVLGVLVLLSRGAGSMFEAWRRLALPLAVVLAAGHIAKGLAKFNSWAGYLPYALQEPAGVHHAQGIAGGTIAKPGLLVPMSVVSGLSVALVLVLALFALRESRLADEKTSRGRMPAIVLVGLVSAYLAFGWGFLG